MRTRTHAARWASRTSPRSLACPAPRACAARRRARRAGARGCRNASTAWAVACCTPEPAARACVCVCVRVCARRTHKTRARTRGRTRTHAPARVIPANLVNYRVQYTVRALGRACARGRARARTSMCAHTHARVRLCARARARVCAVRRGARVPAGAVSLPRHLIGYRVT